MASEFKKTTGQLERGMETLCAFLNGDGGTVLFGVTDEGKIIGQDIAGKTKETIGEAISRFGPSANIRIFYVPMPDSEKKVIALHVESSKMECPFCYRGRPYMRFQNVTTVMPQDKYRQLLMERGGNYSWEAMTNPDLKISDLDEHAILGAVRGGIRCGRLPEATIREDLPTILEKFNLLHDGRLNNASAVLFGRDLYYYPQCLLRMARFKGTTKNEFIDNQRVTGQYLRTAGCSNGVLFQAPVPFRKDRRIISGGRTGNTIQGFERVLHKCLLPPLVPPSRQFCRNRYL